MTTLYVSTLNAQSGFAKFLQTHTSDDFYKKADIGIAVCDLNSGTFLGGTSHEKWMIPASSLKVITTFAALDLLGKDYQFETKIVTDGFIDHEGTLLGNIYIIGSGDPSLGSEKMKNTPSLQMILADIVSAIQKAGIKKIDGYIVADPSYFPGDPVAPSWQWNDIGNYYGSGAWGINVLDNTYTLVFDRNKAEGKTPSLLYIEPNIPDFKVTNDLIIGPVGSGDQSVIFSIPGSDKAIVSGSIPAGKSTYKVKGAINHPPLYLAFRLHQALELSNITNKGYKSIEDVEKKEENTLFYTHYSPTLNDIVRTTNHESINMYCEAMLHAIAREKSLSGLRKDGLLMIEKYLDSLGLTSTDIHLEDGSGLSSRNLVSPLFLAQFISKMKVQNGLSRMTDLLPEVGKEGTVASLLKNNPIRKDIWAKSGSMSSVYSLTGICKTQSGKWVSFSIIINGSPEKSAVNRSKTEEILISIHKFF